MASARTNGDLIEEYLADMRRCGRLRSPHSRAAYLHALTLHAEDVGDEVGLMDANRLHVKRTLLRWEHPNSQRRNHSVLGSFYTWAVEEGYRETNPAEQVRKARQQQARGIFLSAEEVDALLCACETERERRLIYLGLCTGARCAELRGFRGRHFARDGLVQIASDGGAKGLKTRWVPVIDDLEPIVAEIRENVGPKDPVLASAAGRNRGGALSHTWIAKLTKDIAARAGIACKVSPHTMRRAFATMIARPAGLRTAQVLLGHASIETTARIYVDAPTIDEICAAVEGISYRTPKQVRPNLLLLSA